MTTNPIKRDIIVIGASAGGVSVLQNLFRALPADLPAIIGVVLHRGAWYGGNVSTLYGKLGYIRVREAKEGDCLEHGTVYFAPADHHLLFGATRLQLSRGPKVHFARPAIDRLFFSAARTFTTRVAGILLTGANRDGGHGLAEIKGHGGATFVQRPDEAVHPEMPLSGLQEDAPALVSSHTLPALLIALATGQLITV